MTVNQDADGVSIRCQLWCQCILDHIDWMWIQGQSRYWLMVLINTWQFMPSLHMIPLMQQQWEVKNLSTTIRYVCLEKKFTLYFMRHTKVIKMFLSVLNFRLNHHSLFLFYSQAMTMKLWKEVNLLCLAQLAKIIVLTIILIAAKFHLRRWLDFLKIVALI